jgi:2-polyprenyl-3-methyl-5-hydroxy-6-metoxy-1,4-benzoquinol methylase
MEEACCVCGTVQRPLFRYRGFRYRRCPACGLVTTYPLPDNAAIEQHYAAKFAAGNYALRRRFEEEYQAVERQYLALLERRVQVARPSVLDVGCFTGGFLQLLARRGWDVYGLELQQQAVEVARRHLPGRIFQADLYGDRFPQRQFDVVSLLGLIEHVTDPMRMLGRCAELLGAGGTLIVETPSSSSLPARAMGRYWPPYAPVEHIHLFSRRALRQAVARVGLETVQLSSHWKSLPVAYVFEMLQTFGPELHRLLAPAYRLVPRFVRRARLPFYVGEMILLARKPPRPLAAGQRAPGGG